MLLLGRINMGLDAQFIGVHDERPQQRAKLKQYQCFYPFGCMPLCGSTPSPHPTPYGAPPTQLSEPPACA